MVVPTGKQRMLVFAAIAVVMLAVGIGVARVQSNSNATNEEKEALHALIERTAPGMCEMQRRVNANDRSGALNIFYDEVHQGSHVLAAELAKTTSTEAGSFLKAKSLVEADLRTLAPALKEHVDAFAIELEKALDAYEPGLWKPCAA